MLKPNSKCDSKHGVSTDQAEQVRLAAESLEKEFRTLDHLIAAATPGPEIDAKVTCAMDACLRRLAQSGCWGPENRLLSNELWSRTGEWLKRGSLLYQARTKPRGYAGDFELLDRIDRGWCCSDPIGAALDRYFQKQAAPLAVRRRYVEVARMIAKTCHDSRQPVRIANVGCGPAAEVVGAWPSIARAQRELLELTLFDIDPHSLAFAQQRLASKLGNRLECERTNLARLPRHERWSQCREAFHLVYCPGLFDYLDDESATQMLAMFHRWLIPKGTLVVFNFSPCNPTRAFMEWIGNWYLTYRDVDAMQALVRRAGLVDVSQRVIPIAEGVLVMAEIRKSGPDR